MKRPQEDALHGLKLRGQERVAPILATLVVGKLLRCIGFWLAAEALNTTRLVTFAFWTCLGAAILFVLIQKPFSSGDRLNATQWRGVIVHSAISAIQYLLLIVGVLLAGPTRAVLLGDYSDVALIGIVSIVMGSNTPTHKARGAVLCVVAVLLMLLWDNPSGGHVIAHTEITGTHEDYHTVRHNKYLGHFFLSDHVAGMLSLLLASGMSIVRAAHARTLSVDLGGAKRLNALASLGTVAMLVPVLIVQALFAAAPEATEDQGWTDWLRIGACVLFLLVINFHVDKAASARIDPAIIGFVGLATMFLASVVVEALFTPVATVTFATAAAWPLLLAGQFLLAAPRDKARAASRGTLIGYSLDGLPLYNAVTPAGTASLVGEARAVLRTILTSRDSKHIFLYLCLNFAFMLVEFMYGIWTNSLGLVSDAFHMMFDCTALFVGLYASIMARWKPTRAFSYGFGRVEVLSGFANGVFLIVIALRVFSEALERLWAPPEIKTDRLVLVSAVGFCVNLVGLFAFSHAHLHHGHSHGGGGGGGGSHGHSHGGGAPCSHSDAGKSKQTNANMQAVFLHVAADTLGSMGVIVSSLLVEHFGWLIADPLASLFISTLIFFSVLPLVGSSAATLLLATPDNVLDRLPAFLSRVAHVDGVAGTGDVHVWSHNGQSTLGTLHVAVHAGVAEARVVAAITALGKELGIAPLTIQCNVADSSHAPVSAAIPSRPPLRSEAPDVVIWADVKSL